MMIYVYKELGSLLLLLPLLLMLLLLTTTHAQQLCGVIQHQIRTGNDE